MELIQNWANKIQQAKSFQMMSTMSKLNYANHQTLLDCVEDSQN